MKIATPEERKAILSESMTCPRCDGGGVWDFGQCQLCYGDGRVTGERVFYLFKDFDGLRESAKKFATAAGF